MNGIRYERVFLRPGFPMSDPGPASAFQTPSGVPTMSPSGPDSPPFSSARTGFIAESALFRFVQLGHPDLRAGVGFGLL